MTCRDRGEATKFEPLEISDSRTWFAINKQKSVLRCSELGLAIVINRLFDWFFFFFSDDGIEIG